MKEDAHWGEKKVEEQGGKNCMSPKENPSRNLNPPI